MAEAPVLAPPRDGIAPSSIHLVLLDEPALRVKVSVRTVLVAAERVAPGCARTIVRGPGVREEAAGRTGESLALRGPGIRPRGQAHAQIPPLLPSLHRVPLTQAHVGAPHRPP